MNKTKNQITSNFSRYHTWAFIFLLISHPASWIKFAPAMSFYLFLVQKLKIRICSFIVFFFFLKLLWYFSPLYLIFYTCGHYILATLMLHSESRHVSGIWHSNLGEMTVFLIQYGFSGCNKNNKIWSKVYSRKQGFSTLTDCSIPSREMYSLIYPEGLSSVSFPFYLLSSLVP